MSKARICKSVSTVKAEPCALSEASSELLFGESVLVLADKNEWFHVTAVHDGYKGYIESANCDFSETASTHRVSTRATCLFEKPDIKSALVQRLVFGSELTVVATDVKDPNGVGCFYQTDGGSFVWAAHCLKKSTSLQLTMTDIARENYLNTPYLWGGRSTDGCDCSGMVQMLAMATGIKIPRDSIDQETALTSTVEFYDRKTEDLIFWPGHVGILSSTDTLLHATAHSMCCCEEPLKQVIQRAGTPSSVKRMKR